VVTDIILGKLIETIAVEGHCVMTVPNVSVVHWIICAKILQLTE